jgi:hypothetical protein
MGSPNATGLSSTPGWSNLTFAVPGPSASSHDVQLLDSGNVTDSFVTSGFIFYGHFFMIQESGSLQSQWYAVPSDTDGVYSLKWNTTGDSSSDKVIITLRDIKPSNAGSNNNPAAEVDATQT